MPRCHWGFPSCSQWQAGSSTEVWCNFNADQRLPASGSASRGGNLQVYGQQVHTLPGFRSNWKFSWTKQILTPGRDSLFIPFLSFRRFGTIKPG
jgi:hypothetical protein